LAVILIEKQLVISQIYYIFYRSGLSKRKGSSLVIVRSNGGKNYSIDTPLTQANTIMCLHQGNRVKRKDSNEISTLTVNDQLLSDNRSKATALNNYISNQSLLTKIYHVFYLYMDSFGSPLSNVTFSLSGIQHLLSILDTNKASGLDRILYLRTF